jgi:CDP-4-dehydro-6-deoxyglucose reductase
MFDIKLNNVTFNAQIGKSIFLSALENDILIEHSCLNGRCSNCKAKVIEGSSVASTFELGLNEDEKAENYILTCVREPLSELTLDLSAITGVKLEKPKIFSVKIHEILILNESILKLVLRFPPTAAFKFIPGQYVNIIKGDIKRSYSIGGIENGNMIVFYIKKYEEGLMSEYLFNQAKSSDLLRIEGPFGTFFLRQQNKKNLILLATGTGIAPFISILTDAKCTETLKNKNVYLFHGGRLKEDLILKTFLEKQQIHYFPVLSRENISGYHSGYVQDVIIDQNLDLADTTVYACGSNYMIEAAKKLLIEKSLNESQFYSDAFVVTK